MIKRVIIYLIVITLLIQFCVVNHHTVNASSYGLNNPRITNGITTWDCVYFGKYKQSSNASGGFNIEPIKWRVLFVNQDEAILLSDLVIDAKRMHDDTSSVTWPNTFLYKWLNSEFKNSAFELGQQYINGPITVPSTYEVMATEYGFPYNNDLSEERNCYPTEYAKKQGCKVETKITNPKYYGHCNYWLHLTAANDNISMDKYPTVSAGGAMPRNSQTYVSAYFGYYYGVRPLLRLRFNNSIWRKAGTVSSDGTIVEETTTSSTTSYNTTTQQPIHDSNAYYNNQNDDDYYNGFDYNSSNYYQNSKRIKKHNINCEKTYLKKIKPGIKNLKIKWKKAQGITGYKLQYSLKKNFKKAKTIIIKKPSKTKKTIKRLKQKKKYYIRIRTYKIVNGKKYQSSWSKVKSKKTK